MKASNLLLYFVQDNPTPLQQELEGKMRLCRLTQSQSCSQIATFSNASDAQRIQGDRKSTRLNSSHRNTSRMPSSA